MKYPTIYIVHPSTGELIGTSYADPDPLEEGNWLIPANSSLELPPDTVKGEAVVLSAQGWIILPDYRGTAYSTLTGELIEYTQLGELPDGLTAQPRPTACHIWENGAWTIDKAMSDRLTKEEINATALAYLSETDWYIIRKQEVGDEVPTDVSDKRKAARLAVVR